MKRLVCSAVLSAFSLQAAPCSSVFSPDAYDDAAKQKYRSIGIFYRDNVRIDKYRTAYLSRFRVEQLSAALESGSAYRAYIRAKLAEHHLPPCLEYLPLVESGYKPTARSRSGAAGLWQFMENSIQPFMSKTEWLDERFDPWVSTDAAMTKLSDNYRMFGDWLLALAAYNAGAGAVRRALSQLSAKTFWQLADSGRLRRETVEYVPKFLAIADVIMNAAYYGVSFPEIDEAEKPFFAYVPVKKPLDVVEFCAELELDRPTFDYFNPALLRGITPPVASYQIRVPAEIHEKAAVVARNAKAAPYTVGYRIREGDTLWAISRRHKTTVAELCRINRIRAESVLSVGALLHVPRD